MSVQYAPPGPWDEPLNTAMERRDARKARMSPRSCERDIGGAVVEISTVAQTSGSWVRELAPTSVTVTGGRNPGCDFSYFRTLLARRGADRNVSPVLHTQASNGHGL